MSIPDGFTDLRLDQQNSNSSEGFWPSFTDIMTVIVMIFLMSMVVLLIKNLELVQQLQHSVESERQAAEIARATTMERNSLDSKLTESESEIAMLRFRVSQAIQEAELYRQKISDKDITIDMLTASKKSSRKHIQSLSTENFRYAQNLSQLKSTLAKRNIQLSATEKQIKTLEQLKEKQTDDLHQLETTLLTKNQLIESLEADSAQTNQTISLLETDYSSLKSKYEKLIKPARSPAGKIVVEVYHKLTGNKHLYKIKHPSSKYFTTTTEVDLHKSLTDYKQKYPAKLYIKIVFPKDSGLSYSDAWKFTNNLLIKYDSYYAKTKK
jgi:hypothetical protein